MTDRMSHTDALIATLGIEAYRVGGSVRDEVMGRNPKDADYMVRGATLSELGLAALRTGAKISSLKLRDGRKVGVRIAKKGYGLIEVALPRTEVSTGPGRQDFEIVVDPTLSILEDAKRRDFTFNALYKLVPDGPVADPTTHGLYDLQHKVVRTTHPDSFRDDPLRTLRALRFVSTLGFELAMETHQEMIAHADAVNGLTQKGVSGTALEELNKILMGDNVATALRLMRDTGVLEVLLPELKPMLGFEQGSRYHDMTTDEHTFKALETAAHVDAPLRVRMALLFHDSGKPETAWLGKDGRLHYYATKKAFAVTPGGLSHHEIEVNTEDHEIAGARRAKAALARLNATSSLRKDVDRLIRAHMVTLDGRLKGSKVRRARVEFGDDLLRDLYLHRLCDLCGKGKPNKNFMTRIGELERERAEAAAAGVPSTIKELPISGHDLIALGVEGRAIGEVLRQLLDEVVCQPELNDREWLLERAKALV